MTRREATIRATRNILIGIGYAVGIVVVGLLIQSVQR